MMNRRTLLAAGPALAGTLSLDADAEIVQTSDERPSFDIMPEGSGWKIRSWEWVNDAWRPLIARASMSSGNIQLVGTVAYEDAATVQMRLAEAAGLNYS